MRTEPLSGVGGLWGGGVNAALEPRAGRQALIVALLVLALFAFEIFNFDTTRYALEDLLGSVSFAGLRWATILAIAFCAIDFAGLARLFAPERESETWSDSWYLMGAWLLAATMNALMTWWAVNLTLLNHAFGNEVLSREQLLHVVPPFVAALVWLTRILFIAAFSFAGEQLFTGEQVPVQDAPYMRRHPTAHRLPTNPSALARNLAQTNTAPSSPQQAPEPLPTRRMPRPLLASMVSARGDKHRASPLRRR
jgi:hypothetical protein